jgi:GNAT superfamily N-acetyltransferase
MTDQFAPQDVSSHAAVLLRLQRAAYAVEAALINDDRIPTLHETEEDLVAAGLHWLVEIDGQEIVGALGYTKNSAVTDIDRLIVDPRRHRRGIGRRLVGRIIELSQEITVSTGRDNAPARQLYETAGFTHVADREVLPGLIVSDYAIASTATGSPRSDRVPHNSASVSRPDAGGLASPIAPVESLFR